MSANPPHRIVATGASGFIGRRLAAALGGRLEAVSLGGPGWRESLEGARWREATVIHLAARVHEAGRGDAAEYERDNAEKTRALANAAAEGGARRLVFLSTIKVNGEETTGAAFQPGDPARPQDAYARSKALAEESLADCSHRTGLELVVVRSPLVVGPGAKGNLAALLKLVDSNWPLPLASVANRRTFIAADDLAALLLACAEAPQAVGRTFLAGDPDAVSTPRLVRVLRAALGRPERLWAAPPPALEWAAAALGQADRIRRLTRSLEVDTSETQRALAWKPRVAMDEALREMARAYRASA